MLLLLYVEPGSPGRWFLVWWSEQVFRQESAFIIKVV